MSTRKKVLAISPSAIEPAQLRRVAADISLQKLPGYLLRRLDSRAATLYEEFTGQSDLTPRQFGVLLTLFQSGVLPQTELGSRLHLDRSTLAEMLQRMDERGLVERQTHERDKRAVEVALTKLGEKALMRTIAQALQAQDALLSPLPDYLRPVFMKCLEILANADIPEGRASNGT